MERKFLKFSLACITGTIILVANPKLAMAYEQPVAGFTYDKISQQEEKNTDTDTDTISSFSISDVTIPGFTNIGIANVDTNLLIREKPSADSKTIGKLPRYGGIDIVEHDDGSGWTKVSFGKLTGYVKSEYLITGPAAASLAIDVGQYIAKSNTDGLRVRSEPSIDSAQLDTIAKGEELIVIDELIVTYGEEHNKWVKVSLDSDSEDGIVGYVAKEYVDLEYSLKKASSTEELQYGLGVSSIRVNLVNYAKQFIGNPYVFGGNSLTNGIDCSGFVKQIYGKFGYTGLARHSGTQARGGTTVSRSNLKAGDLVFYGSGGSINHVAIYMGNGRIVHASNRRDGIKTSNVDYRKPLKYVRYINN